MMEEGRLQGSLRIRTDILLFMMDFYFRMALDWQKHCNDSIGFNNPSIPFPHGQYFTELLNMNKIHCIKSSKILIKIY